MVDNLIENLPQNDTIPLITVIAPDQAFRNMITSHYFACQQYISTLAIKDAERVIEGVE